MVINSLKELEKLMILCRKRGVDSIKIDNIEFRLSDEPVKATRQSLQAPIAIPGASTDAITEDTKIETDGLTEEQLRYWSAGFPPDGAGE